jgi:antitoxin ParD1/3/4
LLFEASFDFEQRELIHMAEDLPDGWRTAEEKARDIAQARALKEQARKGGLRFEAYLPSGLAEWVLDFVERGVFVDPSEAVFVIFGEHKDLEPHADLRQEALKRSIQAAIDDPRPSIPYEEVKERMEKLSSEPRPEPAIWRKQLYGDPALLEVKSLEEFAETCGMKHADFQIGMEFLTATGRWRVTDIGTRTVIAIKLDQADPRNYNGPPYSIVESVFDEYAFEGCAPVDVAHSRPNS